jgi:hypothetical protein
MAGVMPTDARLLLLTCYRGCALVAVGPDPDHGGANTVRWHLRTPQGSRWSSHPWPTDADPTNTSVPVSCRDYRGLVSVVLVGRAYDGGLRGRVTMKTFTRALSGQ